LSIFDCPVATALRAVQGPGKGGDLYAA
jgi:hypothetical protein